MKEIAKAIHDQYPNVKQDDFIGCMLEHIDKDAPNASYRMSMHYACAKNHTEMCATKEWFELSKDLPPVKYKLHADIEARMQKGLYDLLWVGLATNIQGSNTGSGEGLTKTKGVTK